MKFKFPHCRFFCCLSCDDENDGRYEKINVLIDKATPTPAPTPVLTPTSERAPSPRPASSPRDNDRLLSSRTGNETPVPEGARYAR